jgi:hypothetical protein
MSRLVEAASHFLNSYEDRKPLSNEKYYRANNPYAEEAPYAQDEAPKPINLIREQSTNYGSFGDAGFDSLLVDCHKHARARRAAIDLYERKRDVELAIELLEGTEFERQLDEAYGGYNTNKNTLRAGGGYAHGLDQPGSVTDLQGRQSAGAYGGDDDDFLNPQQAENLAKLVAMRRESERANLDNRNYGGGNFQNMAGRLDHAPAELGRGARVGQENPGPQLAHHDGPYKTGSSFNANRALVSWLTKNLPSAGSREDRGYFDGHSFVDAPALQTSDRHDRAFTAVQHALPIRDTDAGENEKASGRGRTQAGASSRHYRAHMDIAARRGGYGDTGYDTENGDERPGVGWERNAF